jgi:hypothetical protein
VACLLSTEITIGNFIVNNAFSASFYELKRDTLSLFVVVKLNFFRKIHRHFSIESITFSEVIIDPGIRASFKDDLSDGKDVVANSQNIVISLVE